MLARCALAFEASEWYYIHVTVLSTNVIPAETEKKLELRL
jgi:hypothetical protein